MAWLKFIFSSLHRENNGEAKNNGAKDHAAECSGVHELHTTLDLLDQTTKNLADLETKFAEVRNQVRSIREGRDQWQKKMVTSGPASTG